MNQSQSINQQVLSITHHFLSEMEASRAKRSLDISSELERDLGIDSLGRMELFSRFEKQFHVTLPSDVIATAQSLKEISRSIQQLGPSQATVQHDVVEGLLPSPFNPDECDNFLDVLLGYAKQDPNRPHIYLWDEHDEEKIITYGELYDAASQVAAGLIARGLKPTETVALMLPSDERFFAAFWGIILAGGIPVPIYPPFRADQIEDYIRRESKILDNAQVRFLITFHAAESLSHIIQGFIPSLISVLTMDEVKQAYDVLPELSLESSDAALIQYTSGSTGDPKGVLLTHGNLLANLRAAGKAIGVQPGDSIVSWLPLYHDMGLIGTWLGALYYGVPTTIMSPLTFLSKPARWLWAIHYHRASISAAPNFAYELCIRKIQDHELEGLDLSCWRLAFNGAEAISAHTLKRFTEKFSRYGFRAKALYPVYGLAESTVALTFPPPGREPHIDTIERDELLTHHRAVACDSSSIESLDIVGCGFPLKSHEIRIVDENDQAVKDRLVGHIQFRGPSTMHGYFRNPEATAKALHDGWLDTGDLGYSIAGELFVTGRSKDLIIKAGRNIYPQEIEDVVAEIEGVRKGCVVAFGEFDQLSTTEKLVVVVEIKPDHEQSKNALEQIITATIVDEIGLPPDHIIFVSPHTIPKTSSGKLRRSACKQLYLTGKLHKQTPAAWFQASKMFLKSAWVRSKRFVFKFGRYLYAAYMMAVVLLSILFISAVISILTPEKAAIFAKHWATWLARLCLIRIRINDIRTQAYDKNVVYVSNHASYIDAFIFTAIMPPGTQFVGKQELLDLPLFGRVMKKIGHIAVDRMDFAKSIESVDQIEQSLKAKRSIFIFPEGTFTYATGIRPFKLGAFKVVLETQTAIVPMALEGTRYVLRDGELPRPGRVTVTIGDPIIPASKDWSEITRLRNETRDFISKYSGEKPLDLVKAGAE